MFHLNSSMITYSYLNEIKINLFITISRQTKSYRTELVVDLRPIITQALYLVCLSQSNQVITSGCYKLKDIQNQVSPRIVINYDLRNAIFMYKSFKIWNKWLISFKLHYFYSDHRAGHFWHSLPVWVIVHSRVNIEFRKISFARQDESVY